MLSLLREHEDELTAHFRARFQGERDREQSALRTFCRPDCPHLQQDTSLCDGGPIYLCAGRRAELTRLHGLTACPASVDESRHHWC